MRRPFWNALPQAIHGPLCPGAVLTDIPSVWRGSKYWAQGTSLFRMWPCNHSGVYVCAANKPGTRVRRTAQGRLNVQAPPEFVQWPHSLSRALGTPAVFTCSAQGTPPPHITWLRNGQPLQPSEHVRLQHSNSTLAIHQVHVDDEGLYQCRAENIAGSVQASARLAVLGAERLPGPPLGLEARTVSPISVLLAWHEPQHNANELIGYVVHIRRAQDPEEQEYQEAVSKSTVEHLVTELDPSTMYIFFVKAYSSRGASQPSITITAETLGEVPAVPALHVRVLNSSAVQLSWEPSSKLGRVQGFKLYYRKIYAPHLTGPVSLPANITAHTLAHLAVQSSYEIRLLAFNEFGNGNFSARLISLKENPQASLLEPSTSDCKTETWHDGHSTTGIIIGIHIGLACIVVCALFLLLGYRRRLFWWLGMNIARTRQQSRNGNGPHMGADHTNGIVGDRGRSTHPSIITTDGKCTSRELLAEPRELESLVQTPEPVPLLQLANESQNILLMDEVRDLHSLNPQSSRVAEKILPHESGLFRASVMKETTLQEPEGQLTSVEDTAVIAVPICPDASSPGTSSTTGPNENCVSSKLPNSKAALPAEESASTMAVLLSVAAGRCHGKVVVKDSESTLH
uniref:Immunoglobulin superfamily, DCC subclass, member 3 n=1 Tax=Eptatretus burgeri TaxID=7764 RepID=A0A8C4QZP2_EPTBU